MFGPPRGSRSRSRREYEDDEMGEFSDPFVRRPSTRASSRPFEEDLFAYGRITRRRRLSPVRERSPPRPRESPYFNDPFTTSPSFQDPFSPRPISPPRRSSTRSRYMESPGTSRAVPYLDDLPAPRRSNSRYVDLPPPSRRRGAADLSSAAADPYDPFSGGLGTGYRPSIYGDPELPPYRSGSEYHRGSASRAPAYDEPGRRLGSRAPPPYSSYSSQDGYGGYEEPMQYPPTRRESHYYQTEERRPSRYGERKY